MTAQALLLADDWGIQDWLGDALGERIGVLPADSRDADGFAREVAATPEIGLVFVQFDDENAAERAGVVERVIEMHPDLPVVAVGERESSGAVLAAMRAGARDFLVVRRDDENLGPLLDRILRTSPRTGTSRDGGGRLFSVVSGAPSGTVPFLAAHVALGLQARCDDDQRVILVDLTVPGGASLVFLDTEQNYSALDALRDVDRCDQTLIDTAFTRYRDGLYLLSLPEDAIAPPAPDADDLGRLLDNFMDYFDYVVVAADNGIGREALSAVVARSRRSLLLTDQSVLRSRRNKHLLHALRQSDCPMDTMGLVIDNYRPSLGLEPERIAELLDLPYVTSFTGRQRDRISAMNAGESMFEHAPKDPYCREVEELIDTLTGQTAGEAKRGGLFRRWFG